MNRREFLAEVAVVALGGVALGSRPLVEKEASRPKPISNYTFCATIARADVPNGNKRIYPREVLEQAVRVFQADHKKHRSLVGELGLPNEPSIIHFQNASHVITDLRMQDDYLVAEIEVLDSPCGRVLRTMLETNSEIVAFRTRGVGNGHTDGGNYIIGESYKLITIDALPAKEAVSI